jgi:Uma2 family endonuclease
MTDTLPKPRVWSDAELAERFGDMPAERIRRDPPPGTATFQDVLAIEARGERCPELVDGVLLEKTVGFKESELAILIAVALSTFVRTHGLGKVAGADGTIRLLPRMVRIPDVAFYSRERMRSVPRPVPPIPHLVPDLAVEVLSESNTRREMDQKLADYFRAGVRLVWYVDPQARTVQVFASPADVTLLTAADTLTGGEVLPGFALPLAGLFAELDEE